MVRSTSSTSVKPVTEKISNTSSDTLKILTGFFCVFRRFNRTLNPALEIYCSLPASSATSTWSYRESSSSNSFSSAGALVPSILPSRGKCSVPLINFPFIFSFPAFSHAAKRQPKAYRRMPICRLEQCNLGRFRGSNCGQGKSAVELIFPASSARFTHRGALSLGGIQNLFPDPQALRRHLEKLVRLNKIHALLKAHLLFRREP